LVGGKTRRPFLCGSVRQTSIIGAHWLNVGNEALLPPSCIMVPTSSGAPNDQAENAANIKVAASQHPVVGTLRARLRLEDKLPNQDEYTRHQNFWFKDGSVILCAHTTLFRVHMSQLARHSEFFQDLFSLPQPCGSAVTKDDLLTIPENAPFLRLHDDPKDVASLLAAIYDGP
jgi:hypothetical protein